MTFDVILRKHPNNGYSARPVLWPDITVHGATQQEVLHRVQQLIRELLEQTQVVQVDVEAAEAVEQNPWLAKAGMFQDDPTWDDFLEKMADYRRQLDVEDLPESV
ncbi:MAG: hypothetical protein R3C14_06945 [Caldilineaceae bacterium]